MDKDPLPLPESARSAIPPASAAAAQGACEPQTTNSAEEPKANGEAQKTGFRAGLKRRAATVRGKLHTTWTFAKEAWDEHDLWVEALAVKGGASAIVIAAVVGISAIVAMPFFAAAGVIAGCGALCGIGIYGCAAAGAKAWESVTDVYARVMGREPKIKPHKERKDILERLGQLKWVKKALNHPLAQKVRESRAWKVTQKFTKRREDSILHGMAVGGALVTLALGATVLATQVLVLPVVAVGGLLTWATAEVAVCFASGIYGMYLSGQSILKKHREKKEKAAGATAAPLLLPQTEAPAISPATDKPALTETFTGKAATNDNAKPRTEDAPVAIPAAKRPNGPGA